jgi:tRNA (mo5U34)-methyltransferase
MQNLQALEHIDSWRHRLNQTGWWHSFELPDGTLIEGATTIEALRLRVAQYPIPEDLTGKRVLDAGTWDGWFAFEMERRGAEVVAIDRWDNPRFRDVHEIYGSRIDYRQMDVYDLHPSTVGRYDIVLFLGVLYHLKHPLLALERVCSVAEDMVVVDSFVLDRRHCGGIPVEEHSLMGFYENSEFGGQFDNWVAPTVPCLMALCRTAGFATVELHHVQPYGATVTCRRKWPGAPLAESLRLHRVCHGSNGGINFSSMSSDEYAACWLESPDGELSVDLVQPEMGGYGSRATSVTRVGGYWQVHFKVPPGLAPGWHDVTVRAGDRTSNPLRVAVDLPLHAPSLAIHRVADATTFQDRTFSRKNGLVTLWLAGVPDNADVNNTEVYLGRRRIRTTYVGAPAMEGPTQVNAEAAGAPVGRHPLWVRMGGDRSEEVIVEVTG